MTAQLLTAPRTAAPATAALYQQRLNRTLRTLVDQGIAVQSSFNTVCAVEYMKSHNIDPDVISRVLLHPGQRRGGS